MCPRRFHELELEVCSVNHLRGVLRARRCSRKQKPRHIVQNENNAIRDTSSMMTDDTRNRPVSGQFTKLFILIRHDMDNEK